MFPRGVMPGAWSVLPGTVLSPNAGTEVPGTVGAPLGVMVLPLAGLPAAGAATALISACESLPSRSRSRSSKRPTKPCALAASSREMKPSPLVSTALKDFPVKGSDNGLPGAMLLGGVLIDGEGDEGAVVP